MGNAMASLDRELQLGSEKGGSNANDTVVDQAYRLQRAGSRRFGNTIANPGYLPLDPASPVADRSGSDIPEYDIATEENSEPLYDSAAVSSGGPLQSSDPQI